jgi:hypothetical protein
MPDFLSAPFANGLALSPAHIAVRLVVALVLGAVVSLVYRLTRDEATPPSSFPTTLVLLTVLIAMVTQVIGDNVARAFSLVGALSIVRFRTVVRDTEDTAFVIFAVVVGMGVGANAPWVAVIGMGVVTAAAFAFRPRGAAALGAGGQEFILTLRTGLGHDLQPILTAVDGFVQGRSLRAIGTARQGLSIEATYQVKLRADRGADELVTHVNRLDGVQSVDLRRHDHPEE